MDTRGERRGINGERGISLVEVTILVVIVAIMAAVAMKSMTPALENARQRETEREMEMILSSPLTGVVKEVYVKPHDHVDGGDLLVIFQ